MTWSDLERCFGRALFFSFSQRKLLVVCPVLVLCGVIAVFFRALSFGTTGWISMSLVFLPVLLSSGLFLSLGILLVRIHHAEVRMISLPLTTLCSQSLHTIARTLYFSLFPVGLYLVVWLSLGVFALLCAIPGLGDFFRIVLSFAPFLLILVSLLLCLCNLALLFFVVPAVAIETTKRVVLMTQAVQRVKSQLFTAIVLFLIALFPLCLVVGVLSLAARLTHVGLLNAQHCLSVTFEWFFIMIPFSFLLAPAVLFFFNFSAETYWLLQRREQMR